MTIKVNLYLKSILVKKVYKKHIINDIKVNNKLDIIIPTYLS